MLILVNTEITPGVIGAPQLGISTPTSQIFHLSWSGSGWRSLPSGRTLTMDGSGPVSARNPAGTFFMSHPSQCFISAVPGLGHHRSPNSSAGILSCTCYFRMSLATARKSAPALVYKQLGLNPSSPAQASRCGLHIWSEQVHKISSTTRGASSYLFFFPTKTSAALNCLPAFSPLSFSLCKHGFRMAVS